MTIDDFRSFITHINIFDGKGCDTHFTPEKKTGFIKKYTFYDPQNDSISSIDVLKQALESILDEAMHEEVKSLWSSLYIFESKPWEITEPENDEFPCFSKKEYTNLIMPLIRNKSIVRLCPELDATFDYWADIELEFTNLEASKNLARDLILLQLRVPIFFITGRVVVELETVVILNWGYDLYFFEK